MMPTTSPLFRDLAYIFVAAVGGGLLARWLRQPLIVGYVLGGILLSPFTPGPTVSNLHSLERVAETGVILLMFSIGIEFSLRDLLRVKAVAIVGGPLGILASTLLGYLVSGPLGWSPRQGVVIGTVISVASTMVLARLLIDRGELRSGHGRVMVGITLVEDLAVVLLIVLLPGFGSLQPAQLRAAALALAKAALILVPLAWAAARLVPSFLRRIAQLHNPELFLLVTLSLCLGTAAVTQAVGLSLALGAFLAGLMISGSDFARETLGHLLPLRDAFVAVFFVTIGMLIDPRLLAAHVPLLLAMLGLILVGKFVIWAGVVRAFGYPMETAVLSALGLTQIGEFSFVLVQVARDAGLVGSSVYNAILAASLITILVNAVLVRQGGDWVRRWQAARQPRAPQDEAAELDQHVVVCGFGRIGAPVGAALDAFRVPYVVVDLDPEVVKAARQRGVRCLFGDTAWLPVLQAAHAERARLVVVALPESERAWLSVRNIRSMNPQVSILARAHRESDAEALRLAGATEVVQPEVEAAAALIRQGLARLGLESALGPDSPQPPRRDIPD